jgi:glutamate-ammonia-ligase adenylyltransferase
MKVSDYLTYLAEAIICCIIERVWGEMVSKYGTPICLLGDNLCEMGFIVVGYGKLGGIEIGYASDLDLVFLHAGNWEDTKGADISIDSSQFYIKMGQQVMKVLGGQTITGPLYETDMRLRPDGTKGLLVQHINSYRDYLIERAQTWEQQALLRARAIIGDPKIVEKFNEIRQEVLTIDRDKEKLRNEVKNMRERMLKELDKSGKDGFDLKQGKGGIIDIEFIVQYLTLLHAGNNYSFKLWTDVVRLLGSMVENQILDEYAAFTLRNAYLIYRSYIHKLNLQKLPKILKDEQFLVQRKKIIALYERLLQ